MSTCTAIPRADEDSSDDADDEEVLWTSARVASFFAGWSGRKMA